MSFLNVNHISTFTLRRRLQEIAYHKPELLTDPKTGEQIFNRLQFSRQLGEEDVGTTALYRDYYMTGWGLKEVTEDDVRWTTLVASRTQNKFMICRLLPLIRKASSIIQLSSVKRYLIIY